MEQEPPRFDNINDELEYYKKRTEDLELDLAETKYGLEEFQLSSKELEEELEKEIDSTEKRYNEIKIRNESMRQEVEEWKEKYHLSLKDSNTNINQLTRQLEQLRQQTEMFIKKERELEQNNDDLERTGRATEWSLQEMERKYNIAVERQALLENEVAQKASLTEEVQRLKDELRDANVELAVMKSNQAAQQQQQQQLQQQQQQPSPSVSSLSGSASTIAGRKSPVHNSHEAMPSIRARLAKNNATNRSESRTRPPSMHIPPHQNPVQMVQEMVGRVKSLEARLVSCRSLVTPLLQPPPSYSHSIPSSRTSPPSSQAGSRPGSRPGSRSGSPSKPPISTKAPITTSKVTRRTSLMQSRTLNHSGILSS